MGRDLKALPSDYLQSIQISPEDRQKIGIPPEQVLLFVLLSADTASTKRKRGPEQSNGQDLPRASRRRRYRNLNANSFLHNAYS